MSLAPGAACPDCGYRFEDSTTLGRSAQPGPGDVSICLACAALGLFTPTPDGLVVRLATPTERQVLLEDRRVVDALFATRAAAASSADWPTGPASTQETP